MIAVKEGELLKTRDNSAGGEMNAGKPHLLIQTGDDRPLAGFNRSQHLSTDTPQLSTSGFAWRTRNMTPRPGNGLALFKRLNVSAVERFYT